MQAKKAFTLIEVMVVLSILAIIAILAYNFFGGTMKEAKTSQSVTKIFNDLRNLADANTLYNMKNGEDIVTAGAASLVVTPNATAVSKFLGDGGLKAIPTPIQTGSANYSIEAAGYNVIGSPTAANDDVLFFDHPTEDVCLAYNKRYSTVGEALWDWDIDGAGYTLLPAGFTACVDAYGSGSDPTRFSIIYVLNAR